MLKSFNKRLPGLLDDTHNLLDSGKERNHAIASNVGQLADRHGKLANAQVNCANTMQQSARGINAAVSSSCKSVSEAANIVQQNAESISATLSCSGKSVSEAAGAGRSQYKDDCFFVRHPDTWWHLAFYAKVKETPLPAICMGESDCLDRLCIAMKAIGQGMKEQGKDSSKVPTFHILIPAWYNITVTEPVHFPDEMLPLRLVGPKHDGGKPLVLFALPRPQADLTL